MPYRVAAAFAVWSGVCFDCFVLAGLHGAYIRGLFFSGAGEASDWPLLHSFPSEGWLLFNVSLHFPAGYTAVFGF
ncbi:hypothetical protein B0I37DRAFT_385949 [Chaetomium sp. MPI-CAGE-AT-0009]|nr:hypothetical protein B0I37DRAFT_385949 [Chaetomium sp. MPI-CAGE-AT-0009]